MNILNLYDKYIWSPMKNHWKITYGVMIFILIIPPIIRFIAS